MFNYGFQLKMITSVNAMEEDGTESLTVRRSFRERFLSRPWTPWISTKIIQVPHYKPAMYRVGDMIVYHPALEARIKSAIAGIDTKAV